MFTGLHEPALACLKAFEVHPKHNGPIFQTQVILDGLGLNSDSIDGGQPRAKPHLRKVKPNHVLKIVSSARLATVYQVVG